MQIGFGYLDIVSEDVVEADLERGDTGADALALLNLHEVRPAVLRDIAQLVQARAKTITDRPAVGEIRWRLFGDRGQNAIADFGNRVESSLDVSQQRRAEGMRGKRWDHGERARQCKQIARAS